MKIHEWFIYCLVRMTESDHGALKVDAVALRSVKFNSERILEIRKFLKDMLDDLPVGFKQYYGGGLSVSALRFNKDFNIWSAHTGIHDELIALSIACGYMRFLTDRHTWHLLPARIPFVVIREDH